MKYLSHYFYHFESKTIDFMASSSFGNLKAMIFEFTAKFETHFSSSSYHCYHLLK